jgi:hypothetical protein
MFLVLMYVLSTPFAWTTPNTLQLRRLMKRVWTKLSNTLHCTYGQLVVLHCASNYHSDKDNSLLLKFLQNPKSTKIRKQNKG